MRVIRTLEGQWLALPAGPLRSFQNPLDQAEVAMCHARIHSEHIAAGFAGPVEFGSGDHRQSVGKRRRISPQAIRSTIMSIV